MDTKTVNTLPIIILLIGLVLMIGGIITGKHGASIVGLIVAAVSVQQIMKKSKK